MSPWTVTADSATPVAELQPPISVTSYEALSACPLQLLYMRDARFPRRSTPFARVGVAFHKTLELLPTVLAHDDLGAAVRAALDTFRCEIAAQRTAAERQPRDAERAWPEGRVHHAEQALALLVHRLWPMRDAPALAEPVTRAEVPLASRDGLLRGVIDRVDRTEQGTIIADYKSAETYDEAHLARFTRQILLYAYLWHDAHGEWPIRGTVNFVLLGREVEVPISPEESRGLADAVRLALQSTRGLSPDRLARPGATCSRCDYRPWCEPYWRSGQQLEGRIASVEGVVDSRTSESLQVVWLEHDGSAMQVVLTGPHVVRRGDLRPGTRLRLIDVVVDGAPPFGRLRVTPQSEIWIVE